MSDSSRPKLDPKAPPTTSDIRTILDRFASGDQTLTVAEARSLLDAVPSLAKGIGSPACRLIDTLLENYSTNPVFREAVRRKLTEVRTDLEGPTPSPLESLLAERAAICWLTVTSYENTFARSPRLANRDAEHQQRRIDAAHRRFLSSLKTLATIRKLAVPTIQVNVAEKQVNVVGSCVG